MAMARVARLWGEMPEYVPHALSQKFCYYGYLTASHILRMHAPDVNNAFAVTMFGSEYVLDFVAGTRWPVRYDMVVSNPRNPRQFDLIEGGRSSVSEISDEKPVCEVLNRSAVPFLTLSDAF